MKECLDIIGIGAINFDYIFFCKEEKENNQNCSEIGQENLNNSREMIYENIDRLKQNTEHTHQICGSSYFALKTAHAIFPEMKLSYVGVCGMPTKRELEMGFDTNIKDEFSFLHNTDWLFYDDGKPGIALVRTIKGTRNHVNIDPGVNNKLKEYIVSKEKQEGKGKFIEFLSKSRWIHISSLSDFEQFMYLIHKVEEAKKINPLLKVSMDPGYEYTKKYKADLKEIMNIADYIFLNKIEADNLMEDEVIKEDDKYEGLSLLFEEYKLSDKQLIIIKNQAKHSLVSFQNNQFIISDFWHKKLKDKEIKNDTGAGDAFAGGFISSMLSRQLLSYPLSIEMGTISAIARMKSYADPFTKIGNDVRLYLNNLM